jgi:hypothetical protein
MDRVYIIFQRPIDDVKKNGAVVYSLQYECTEYVSSTFPTSVPRKRSVALILEF